MVVREARSGWRFFPWAVAGGLLFVMVVNGVMATVAFRSFPGVASFDVFDRSNAYDTVLEDAARQKMLGWTIEAKLDGTRPVVGITDRGGKPMEGMLVSATAQRPLGPPMTTQPNFHAVAPGRYVADVGLDGSGQWDLMVTAASGQHSVHMITRIIVP